MKRTIRLRESELRRMVAESVKRGLNETPLTYDIDNFSGKWTKNPSYDDYVDPEGYLDDPYHNPNSWEDEDWIDGDKNMENDYSWDHFDNKSVAPGLDSYYTVGKGAIPREIDNAIANRNREKDWTPSQLRNAKNNKDKWIQGKRSLDDIEDNWEDVANESVSRKIDRIVSESIRRNMETIYQLTPSNHLV